MPFLPLLLQTPMPEYVKSETMVPMRDGVRLYTAIYAPKEAGEKLPILLERTPYGSGPYGPDKRPRRLGPSPEFERDGFIFVSQDVRGRYMSEGDHIYCPSHLDGKGVDESTDAYDTIDYLVKRVPNNNGRVGTWGVSQPGFYASHSLIHAHPALVAVSPQAPVTDRWVGDDDHRHGAFTLLQRFSFIFGFGQPRPDEKPLERYPSPPYPVKGDAYDWFLQAGPTASLDKTMGPGVRYWDQITSHEAYDGFWKPRGVEQWLRKGVRPATLVVGGLFDAEDMYGAFHTYEALQKGKAPDNTFVVGPWTHGGWGGPGNKLGAFDFGTATGDWFRANVQFPWFRYQLKGGERPAIPHALAFDSGANRWESFGSWPPRSRRHTLLLGADGGAALDGSVQEGGRSYVSDTNQPVRFTALKGPGTPSSYMAEDQRFLDGRSDVLTFRTELLASPVTLAGGIEAELRVLSDATDADFVVKLIDERPDGTLALVRWDVMRGKFRDSFERPSPLSVGRPFGVKVPMNGVMHTFAAGHRMTVQVQSSIYPLLDRNSQKFEDQYRATEFHPAKITILCGGQDGSRLTLPVLR
ncbi:CocE/NonD family hydrolase [soil metagenome]